jgi:hypothetical protein
MVGPLQVVPMEGPLQADPMEDQMVEWMEDLMERR